MHFDEVDNIFKENVYKKFILELVWPILKNTVDEG
jgi:hypothetical protein